MASIIKAQGYVLKKKDLPYKDQVVTVFTKEFGKLVLIAKGVRSAKSKRASHLQTGSLIVLEYLEKTGLSLLTQTSLLSGFSEIRNNYLKTRFLFCFFFVIDKLLPDLQEEGEVYRLLHNFVIVLAKSSEPYDSILKQHLRILVKVLGYTPENYKYDVISFIEQLIDEKIPIHDIM